MAGIYSTEDLERQVFSDEPELSAPESALSEFPAPEAPLPEALEELSSLEIPEEFPALEFTLALEDGRELACEAVGIFGSEEAQYIALHPKGDTEGLVHILKMAQGDEDALLLLPIEDDEEQAEAERAFHRMFL